MLNEKFRDGDLLLDAGGFREPERSEPLVEKYLYIAAATMGYSGMVARGVSSASMAAFFGKRGSATQYLTAGLFTLLAVVTIVT